jgi:hypothetical protein
MGSMPYHRKSDAPAGSGSAGSSSRARSTEMPKLSCRGSLAGSRRTRNKRRHCIATPRAVGGRAEYASTGSLADWSAAVCVWWIIGPLHEYARIGGHVVDGSNFVVYVVYKVAPSSNQGRDFREYHLTPSIISRGDSGEFESGPPGWECPCRPRYAMPRECHWMPRFRGPSIPP